MNPRAGLGGLHVLVDDAPHWKLDPVDQARAACAGGARVVQLRAKVSTDGEVLAWARAIRSFTREWGVLFFVNDRFDLALASEADGVHLGQGDLPPRRLPARAREQLRIGRSTHTPDELDAARNEPVDYLAFGPVFSTGSKRGAHPARGLDALADAVGRAAPHPLVAIGGIDAASVALVRRTGAHGFAVIAAVAGADDALGATRALVEAWSDAGTPAP